VTFFYKSKTAEGWVFFMAERHFLLTKQRLREAFFAIDPVVSLVS